MPSAFWLVFQRAPSPCVLRSAVKENGAPMRPCRSLQVVGPEPSGCALPASLDFRSLNAEPEAGRCGPSWPGPWCRTAQHAPCDCCLQGRAAASCCGPALPPQGPARAWCDSWCFTTSPTGTCASLVIYGWEKEK